MRFHLPSFLHHIDAFLPMEIAFEHHHDYLYLLSFVPLRTDFLQDIVARAVIAAFETPIVTPSGPEGRSPIKGLLDQHMVRLGANGNMRTRGRDVLI